ncbi:MAG: helix-turn-helix domain-containing protein, partial [Oscillospiraceae bacterium]|nr:helix-turn-helix domain-containing protein [Oscillospiraceae bacterium]
MEFYEDVQSYERDFKGIWIPKQIWLDKRLSALDKIILAEIDSLDCGERGCYASNRALSEFCQCSEAKITKSISKLISLGYLYIQSFDGRQRQIRSRLVENTKQTRKKYEADSQKIQ